MSTSEIISLVTLAAVIIGAIVNITSLVGRSETKAAANAELKVKLDSIASSMNTIATKQTAIDITLQSHGERITRVEESTKSAHHRLDEMNGREGG